MESAGYEGIAFTPTGRAIVFLANGRTVTITAALAARLQRSRAAEGLPPIPVVDPPVAAGDE